MEEYHQYIEKASRLADEGDTEEAIQAYNLAIEREPQQVGGYYNLAILYHSLGKADEAIKNLQKAAALNPVDASIFNNLGVLYYSKGILNEAESNLSKAVTVDKNYPEPLYGLAKIRVKQGDPLSANSLLERCLRLDPEFEKAKKLLNEIAENFQTYAHKPDVARQKMDNRGVVHHWYIDYTNLPQVIHQEARCCFVLSTGRCGTKLLTNLLGLSRRIRSEHESLPILVYFSKLAYEASVNTHEGSKESRLGIDMARYELIRDTFLRNQIYVETNNRLTFFAPSLAELFKKSRFIHLVRHPGDTVRSGIRRMWYTGRHSHDVGRIVPTNGSINWDGMTQIEKIAWLWNETNQFIEDFILNLGDNNRVLYVKAEDLFSKTEAAKEIFRFLQVDPPADEQINAVIERPVNVQTIGNFPKYNDWNPEWKEQLKKYAVLSSKYNYSL